MQVNFIELANQGRAEIGQLEMAAVPRKGEYLQFVDPDGTKQYVIDDVKYLLVKGANGLESTGVNVFVRFMGLVKG